MSLSILCCFSLSLCMCSPGLIRGPRSYGRFTSPTPSMSPREDFQYNPPFSPPPSACTRVRASVNQQMRQQRDDEGLQWNVSSQIWSNVQKGGGGGVGSTGSQGKNASRLRCRNTKTQQQQDIVNACEERVAACTTTGAAVRSHFSHHGIPPFELQHPIPMALPRAWSHRWY